jgi:hypothetical protein
MLLFGIRWWAVEAQNEREFIVGLVEESNREVLIQ